ESGFHTNPRQQQKNLNSEWKRLEAQSFFWVMLEYLGVERPPVSIATGIITDSDNDEPINGAIASVLDSVYTTDTFESLFNQYSSIPGDLKNGFYYIENIPENGSELIVQAEGYYPDTTAFVVDTTDFTFIDVSLISSIPPNVASTSIGDDDIISPGEELVIQFSRKMNTTSVDSVLKISPEVMYNGSWNSAGDQLTITTNNFEFVTNYTLTIDSTARDNSIYGHLFDGNYDGVAGDSYVVQFATSQADIISPEISDIYPTNTQFSELWPIISATFSEHLDTSLFDDSTVELRLGSTLVPGQTVYYTVGEKSVLNFFPSVRLDPGKNYKIEFSGSISDTVGNSIGSILWRQVDKHLHPDARDRESSWKLFLWGREKTVEPQIALNIE
ncbi:MAG: Ig-like domain-containing protein, partial [Leptolyngbya sp. SIO1D8]|nr:Ig-like domain-containing protein [Leptolyngbya sp. SIO1D8]